MNEILFFYNKCMTHTQINLLNDNNIIAVAIMH